MTTVTRKPSATLSTLEGRLASHQARPSHAVTLQTAASVKQVDHDFRGLMAQAKGFALNPSDAALKQYPLTSALWGSPFLYLLHGKALSFLAGAANGEQLKGSEYPAVLTQQLGVAPLAWLQQYRELCTAQSEVLAQLPSLYIAQDAVRLSNMVISVLALPLCAGTTASVALDKEAADQLAATITGLFTTESGEPLGWVDYQVAMADAVAATKKAWGPAADVGQLFCDVF